MSNQENTLPTNTPETEKVSEPVTSNKPASKSENRPAKKSTGFVFTLFLIILLVGAGAAASYYFWELQQKQAKSLQMLQQSISQLKNEINKTANGVNNNNQITAENTSRIASLNKQIKQTEMISQQAIEVVNRNQRDWALAEVDYLLRIAHQRIAVAKDIAGAIAALKGADARLEQLGDLTLFNIRKQLAKDIGGLNAIHQADVNGISLALDQAISYLPELPFKSVKDEIKIQFTDNEAVADLKIEDKTFVDVVLETVKQIGDIKVHQRSIKTASSGEQQGTIEQLLRTYLLGARLAALHFDQTQFLHEITQASELVRLHYDIKDNRVQQLQKTLLDYSALQLSPDFPELTKAWSLLQTEIKNPAKKNLAASSIKVSSNKKLSEEK